MNNNVKFEQYAKLLREWSGRMNLVAPSTLNDKFFICRKTRIKLKQSDNISRTRRKFYPVFTGQK